MGLLVRMHEAVGGTMFRDFGDLEIASELLRRWCTWDQA